MSVDTFYFGPESPRLFGVLHHNGRPAPTSLVFCPPFCQEMVTTYSRLARFSKQLAENQIGVMRFHPSGTGESDGRTCEFTLDSVLNETGLARQVVEERLKANRLGYFGLRFGATVAVLAAAAQPVDFLVLWCPLINLQRYFHDLLRLQLTKEAVHQRRSRIQRTTRQMVEELQAGNNVDIFGYELSPELYRQMIAVSSWPQTPPARQILWLARPDEQRSAAETIERWRSFGSKIDFETIAEPIFWEDDSSWLPEKFAARTVQWLIESGDDHGKQ